MNTAEVLRDNGIERVLDNGQEWKEFALEQMKQWLQWKKSLGVMEVTTEEFKADLLSFYPSAEPHHFNCWGALTRVAAISGVLEQTDKSTRMKMSASHSRYAKVWRIPG